MCGRYANHLKNMTDWADILGDWPGESALSMDIAPTQNIPVVVERAGESKTETMRWGLIPSWSKTEKLKYATYNARIESMQEKPTFRAAFAKSQACLVPASGYYEWSGEKGHKTRHYIQLRDKSPLVMAGLWEHWAQEDQHINSCTIITRPATASIQGIHPRMPLILNRQDAQNWLFQPLEAQLEYLRSCKDYQLSVSTPSQAGTRPLF